MAFDKKMMLAEASTNLPPKDALSKLGYILFPTDIAPREADVLRDTIFKAGQAGARCLLDDPGVRDIVIKLREQLSDAALMRASAVAVQAIAFDKNPDANWKVSWHQDLIFPFASQPNKRGFDLPSKKDGVDYARPPMEVLEELLAVRFHLDDCGETNGPLRVAPGSHRHGILRSTEIPDYVARYGETKCLANTGDALLLKPLLLHASSPAINPQHRRVLHLVYCSGEAISEKWYRSI
ncbi:MAG TPA: phytanoyl-CoA dioxygenase family protein [Opitutaceae bacterium]|nr:phytanoyl-CoA dioxygenase family protein [Opitutaceae bacterium]